MTATMDPAAGKLDVDLLADIRAHAPALDRGEEHSRRSFTTLGAAGVLGVGAPGNADGRLPEMAEIIRLISGECMSTGFSLWAHRMAVEYLLTAATPFSESAARKLLTGVVPGVTGMASAFKEAAGCGKLELTATPVEGGYEVSGPIRWASNLYADSIMVTAVRTVADQKAGEKLIVALPLDTPGVVMGDHFDLLAMGSTASSYLNLKDAYLPSEQVLSLEFEGFLQKVRPTFLVLQSAMCLGLTKTTLEQSRQGLTGVNSVFSAEVDLVAEKLAEAEATLARLAEVAGGANSPTKKELLSLRLAAAEVSSASANLEIRTAGGKGYASRTAASRRYREAAFIPVQSPSEAQLRWELSQCA